MSIVSNRVGRIRNEGFLISSDADWEALVGTTEDPVEKVPVLSVHEFVKVITETKSFIAFGDGVTALDELAQFGLIAEEEEV